LAVFGSVPLHLLLMDFTCPPTLARCLYRLWPITYSRRYADDARFAFGTGKLGDLGAFTSAIVLAMIAALIGYESGARLFNPVTIAFNQAIPIAALGLGVNLLSAFFLRDDHGHTHDHGHAQTHNDSRSSDFHRDHNLRAAFVHVTTDAAVSALVIIGLVAGRQFGWVWMDPVMGLIATMVILSWSWTLVRSAGAILLDANPDPALSRKITVRLEQHNDRVSDLHLWRLGPGHLGAIVSLVTDHPKAPSTYKKRLSGLPGLSHVTIEVEPCTSAHS
jgi:cation diffusion facilitator family transporter